VRLEAVVEEAPLRRKGGGLVRRGLPLDAAHLREGQRCEEERDGDDDAGDEHQLTMITRSSAAPQRGYPRGFQGAQPPDGKSVGSPDETSGGRAPLKPPFWPRCGAADDVWQSVIFSLTR